MGERYRSLSSVVHVAFVAVTITRFVVLRRTKVLFSVES